LYAIIDRSVYYDIKKNGKYIDNCCGFLMPT